MLLQVELGDAPQDEDDAPIVIDALGAALEGLFNEWRDARSDVEEEWLRDLRAYHGIYEPEILAGIGKKSKVFVHLTRTKTIGAYARIVDLLFQSADKHWGIEPTPEPTLSPSAKQEIIQAILRERGEMASPEIVRQVADMVAETRAERMEQRIEDQLTEARYEAHAKSAILEACMIGTGIIKGPVTRTHLRKHWQRGTDGWGLAVEEEIAPDVEAVSAFDFYPDPYAADLEDATGVFQRHILTRQQLIELKRHPGFDAAVIDEILIGHPQGNHEELTHEIALRTMAGINTTANSGRYVVLEYWGMRDAQALAQAGIEIEATDQVQANVWVCGGRTIKAQLNPLMPERIPYQAFRFERVPHHFWGNGVGRQMRDSQVTINSTVRAMLDNLSISSGPQVEINMDLIDPAQVESAKDLFAWKVWSRSGGDPTTPLLRFYQPTNITQPLTQVLDLFRRFADEETGMPSYTQGQVIPGLNKTATGMSMLMAAANVTLKAIIKNWDECAKGLIEGFYHWNMQWAEEDDVRGDMDVLARGSTALIAKEMQSERLIQFAGMTANPIDAQSVDRPALLRAIAEAMDINAERIVPEHDDVGAGGAGGAGPDGAPGMAPPDGVPDAPPGAMPGPPGGPAY